MVIRTVKSTFLTFDTFSCVSRNFQNSFLNIHRVLEYTLTYISLAFEDRSVGNWIQCKSGMKNRM